MQTPQEAAASVPSAESDPADFYQQHLDRVSRSFAFCIARLESPLKEYIGLGYLLCRIVDTIEDAPWADFHSQEAAFTNFDKFLLKTPSLQDCERWVATFPAEIPDGERLLLNDSWRVFRDFHELLPSARESLLNPIQSMSAGMRHFMARKESEGGKLRLRDLGDVNKYCFFVAGVVGEMLTRLLKSEQARLAPEPATQRVSLIEAFRFGLFLQKVNLLKDQAGDEQVGRFLIPSRPIVRASLEKDAAAAFRYLLSIPKKLESFRLFCAWSLFLGLASLPWIDRAHSEKRKLKIPREETFELLARIEQSISQEAELESLFGELYGRAQASAQDAAAPAESLTERHGQADGDQTFVGLYKGDLSQEQVVQLFRGV